MRRYQRLLPYAARQWRWLLAILLLTIVASGAKALQPWPMKIVVDHGLRAAPLPVWLANLLASVGLSRDAAALIVVAAAAAIALFLIESAIGLLLSLSWAVGGRRMVYDLSADVFAALQRLSILFHSRRRIGDSLSRLSGDSWCVFNVADGLLIEPVQRLATLAAMIAIGFALDPVLAILTLAVTPILTVSSRYFGRRMRNRARLGREAASRLASFVQQTLAAIPVVQAFGTEDRNRRSFETLADDAVERVRQGRLTSGAFGLVNGLILTVGSAVVLYVAATRVLAGTVSLGTMLVFMTYSRQMQNSAGGLLSTFTKLRTAEASIDRLLEILDSNQRVEEIAAARPIARPVARRPGHVVFDAVEFGYRTGEPVLLDVTFEARPGEVVALVGPTGAGKSTTAALLVRLFDPWRGAVLLDGTDLRQATLESVRASVALVPQEPFLLPLTVAENIAYGRTDASRDQVVEAAVGARADEFIRRLPHGYDTVLGERGGGLSGGERQRLAIARALVRDAPVLLLDEPTSALDASTEGDLLETIERLRTQRTVIVIAHRLSTVAGADRIVAMRDGSVVECGTHRELLSRHGLYHRLYTMQVQALAREVVA